MRLLLLLALIPSVVQAAGHHKAIPLEDFVAPNDFDMLRISPDGAHYAASVPYGDRTVLVVLRASDLKQTAVVTFARDAHVSGFVWVNPRQIVYSVAMQHGPLAAPRNTGHLYRVNADGSNAVPVSEEPMWLEDALRDDDEHLLVGFGAYDSRIGLARFHIESGTFDESRITSPLKAITTYSDNSGRFRMLSGLWDRELTPRLYLKKDEGMGWHHINVQERSGEAMGVVGFSADNRVAYLAVAPKEGTLGLEALDLETLQRKPLLGGQRVDLYDVLSSPVDGGVIAARYLDGRPKVVAVNPDDRFAKELLKLERAFPNAHVLPTSYTRDGSKGIYLVSSDVNSGDFYLVDHARGKAMLIASRNTTLDPERMSPMRPFRFKARDGEELEGFVTVPATAAGKPVPLVVMPHGGPKGIFDRWGFNRDVQVLASRGYAVLQVNFRGSGNYGRRFRELGNGEWGGKMQDDVTDATRWALAQGITEPGRICIYGASYGAYAAMMGVVREPGLYACAIGNVGVYDLPRIYREDAWGTYYTRAYIDEMFGDINRRKMSPVNRADGIDVPVLLGAGELDTIAPLKHTRDMHRALKKAGTPVEMVTYPGEAHGYALAKNEIDWQRRVLALLDRTIGAHAPNPVEPTP